jgi:hypothetical protein
MSGRSRLIGSDPRVLQLTVVSRGKWLEVMSICPATAVITLSGPVEKARSSVLPRLCVIAPISEL